MCKEPIMERSPESLGRIGRKMKEVVGMSREIERQTSAEGAEQSLLKHSFNSKTVVRKL